jgi:hypothetical protein
MVYLASRKDTLSSSYTSSTIIGYQDMQTDSGLHMFRCSPHAHIYIWQAAASSRNYIPAAVLTHLDAVRGTERTSSRSGSRLCCDEAELLTVPSCSHPHDPYDNADLVLILGGNICPVHAASSNIMLAVYASNISCTLYQSSLGTSLHVIPSFICAIMLLV